MEIDFLKQKDTTEGVKMCKSVFAQVYSYKEEEKKTLGKIIQDPLKLNRNYKIENTENYNSQTCFKIFIHSET